MAKARYWVGVLYPENMLENWQDIIGDVLQLPYAYCFHDIDHDTKSEHRKDHVHLIVVFNNTTTYNHAFKVFSKLNAQGRISVNKIEEVINIRHMYDYLIHDTETCRKQGKELYDVSCRITGNNFDIGSYEQVSVTEKNDVVKNMCQIIIDEFFTNFADFYVYVMAKYGDDTLYFEMLKTHSGLFERLTKGNYLKWKSEMKSIDTF